MEVIWANKILWNFNSRWIWAGLLMSSQAPCLQNVHLINSLRPGDTIWQHIYGSKLAQVMAWCLTAPSHYLIQCWLTVMSFFGIHLRTIPQAMYEISLLAMSFKIIRLQLHLPGSNDLTVIYLSVLPLWSHPLFLPVEGSGVDCSTGPENGSQRGTLALPEIHIQWIIECSGPCQYKVTRIGIPIMMTHNDNKCPVLNQSNQQLSKKYPQNAEYIILINAELPTRPHGDQYWEREGLFIKSIITSNSAICGRESL